MSKRYFRVEKKYKDSYKEALLKMLKPGDTVTGVVTHVSYSGMTRHIKFFVSHENKVVNISRYIAAVLDEPLTVDGCVYITGGNMDMVFNTVYNLGRTLFPEGFSVLCKKCKGSGKILVHGSFFKPTTTSVCSECNGTGNGRGRNGDMSGWDKDGGYALETN